MVEISSQIYFFLNDAYVSLPLKPFVLKFLPIQCWLQSLFAYKIFSAPQLMSQTNTGHVSWFVSHAHNKVTSFASDLLFVS